MKLISDWYISKTKAYHDFELSILEKHRKFAGLMLISCSITILLIIAYVIYVQVSINTLPEPPEEGITLIFE